MSKVAILMGSKSDSEIAAKAAETLAALGIESDTLVLSAHRTPDEATTFAKQAAAQGYSVIIGIAGLAAHLPGVLASHTLLPVIGVPRSAGPLNGVDALYSIVQMPPGIPVASVGIDNATNAALLAARIIALADEDIHKRLEAYVKELRDKILAGG
jgi:5-(carboxyamino)imidazole ribonucleotide mutase